MAQDYDYAQLIDDFELGADVGPDESLTDYIERRRREFESKANGGSIGIEVLFTDKEPRTKMVSGGFLKGIGSFFKAGKDKIDDIIETKATEKIGFRSRDDIPLSTYSEMKGPIKISEMENIPEDQLKKILRTQELGLYEETPEILKAANLLERFTKKVGGKRVIDYERAEAILGVSLKGDETLDDLFRIEFETRPVEKMADGGRVGLFMGGPALEGKALDIYNSMNSYGFSEQEIANALQGQGLYTPDGVTELRKEPPNIIGSQINQGGGGGGGITELQKTYTTEKASPQFTGDPTAQLTGKGRLDPMGSGFYETLDSVTAKNTNELLDKNALAQKAFFQEVYKDPREISFFDKVKDKFGGIKDKFFQPKVRGTLGTRIANQPKIPIPSFASFLSNYSNPFNMQSKKYNPLLESQLNFAELGDNLIGRDPNSGGLKYGSGSVLAGKNVMSMFGTNDYELALQNFIAKMQTNTRISDERKAARLAQAEAELKALQEKTEAARAAQYGKIDYGRGSDGQRSYSGDAIGASGLGFGVGATTGGPVSNKTGQGRTDYSKGGLATMFTRRR